MDFRKRLREQIEKQRDSYLKTYPDKGTAEIVADHLNAVLALLQASDQIRINKLSSKQYPLMIDTDLPIRFFWNQDGSFDGIEVHVEGLSVRNQQLVEELCKKLGASLGIEHSYSVVADDEENEEKEK